jgi:hypothetical protein
MLARLFAGLVGMAWSMVFLGCSPQAGTTATGRENEATPANSRLEPRVVEFGPGLRIDYRVPQVEIDSEVVLRKGALELFAYSRAPVPKEHESILRTEVKCDRIFQALGLIGLRPGRPMRYDMATKTVELPTGDPVEILVRYEANGKTKEHSACDWMIDNAKNAPMARTHWLFTGSRGGENGSFAANEEGTLVTVVDFPTSLLGLPASHSESDSQLWLTANTDAIPPLGTKVTLILRPASQPSS